MDGGAWEEISNFDVMVGQVPGILGAIRKMAHL
jgi:hypothetical protein